MRGREKNRKGGKEGSRREREKEIEKKRIIDGRRVKGKGL